MGQHRTSIQCWNHNKREWSNFIMNSASAQKSQVTLRFGVKEKKKNRAWEDLLIFCINTTGSSKLQALLSPSSMKCIPCDNECFIAVLKGKAWSRLNNQSINHSPYSIYLTALYIWNYTSTYPYFFNGKIMCKITNATWYTLNQ